MAPPPPPPLPPPLITQFSESKNKRKRAETKQSFSLGDSVEVRKSEEGIEGSWHSAKVINCENSALQVRYDHFLSDDESEHFTEWIKMCRSIDSLFETPDPDLLNYRGFIRPLPPPLPIYQWGIHYGLCVDAYNNDAWWEGVVFDHEDGSEKRLVFFPDTGYEEKVKFEDLRITQDWDEVSGLWNPRGHWLLLELIEENEMERPLLASVNRLWLRLRCREDFRSYVKEWTCSSRSLWRDVLYHGDLGLSTELGPSGMESSDSLVDDVQNRVEETQPVLSGPEEGPAFSGPEEGEIALNCDGDFGELPAKRTKVNASIDVVLGGRVEKVSKLKIVLRKRESSNDSAQKPVALVNGPIGSEGVNGLIPCGGNRNVDSLVPTAHGVPGSGPKTNSLVDMETSSPVVDNVSPILMEISSSEEVKVNVTDDNQANTGGEKDVCDRTYRVHPLAISTTVIGTVGKYSSFRQPCLRKEGAYELVLCGGSRSLGSLMPAPNRGVLYISEDQLTLYDSVVQKFGPMYGNTLHKSVAYVVNLLVQHLMVILLEVNSCCKKTLSGAVLEEWEAVVAMALNMGFSVGWLQDHLYRLRAMWERSSMLGRLRMEFSLSFEKFESLQARATLLRSELVNVETELSAVKATISGNQKAIADIMENRQLCLLSCSDLGVGHNQISK